MAFLKFCYDYQIIIQHFPFEAALMVSIHTIALQCILIAVVGHIKHNKGIPTDCHRAEHMAGSYNCSLRLSALT